MAAGKRPRASARRGRAGSQSYEELARRQVGDLQRARIVGAMVDELCERGVAHVNVAHVVGRSGVSRRTFYEAFSDCEDCVLGAFELALARASARVLPAYEAPGSWRERIRAGLVALLSFLDEEPRLGRVLVYESAAGGQRVLERRSEVIVSLTRAIDEGRGATGTSKGTVELSSLTAEGVVGGALAVIQSRLSERAGTSSSRTYPSGAQADRGRAEHAGRSIDRYRGRRPIDGQDAPADRPAQSMLALTNPLMSMIVLPYLGTAAARRELSRPVPKPAPPAASNGGVTGDPFKVAGMRLTYRTVRVLMAVSELSAAGASTAQEGPSNRQIGERAGVHDQGQISKLLHRLQRVGLVENAGVAGGKGMPNAWRLTEQGQRMSNGIRTHTGTSTHTEGRGGEGREPGDSHEQGELR